MKFYCGEDYEAMSRIAANIISAQIIMKPDCVLGLATGSSPEGTYAQLVEWYKKGDLDFSQVTSVNLDEYRGLSGDNDQSYRYFMNTHLFDHVNIDKSRTFVPNGLEPDSEKACREYDAVVEATGGVDLQLLGIGHNGHIGFNEPAKEFCKNTQCVDLTESTIRQIRDSLRKKRTFPVRLTPWESEPLCAQRKSFLWHPAKARQTLLQKHLQARSHLRFLLLSFQLHNDVTVVCDKAAMSKIKL